MTKEEKEHLKIAVYQNYLDRCLKKTKIDIIGNPTGFVRGIPRQLADDMFILALDKIEQVADKETLKRLKYICEYFISKKSKRRITEENDPHVLIYDKFTVYQEQLKKIKLLLKNI